MVRPLQTRAAFALVALTWLLMVFGSTVRVHGAGLACPDWPLCFGEVVPAYEFGVYLEFGHRVVAGFVSLGLAALTASLWRSGALRASRPLRVLVPIAWLVLAVQVVLGGLTVLELLAEWTVASHLTTGNTFAATLLLIALSVRELGQAPVRDAVSWWARAVPVALAAVVVAQIALGGLVAGAHAGLACATWPSCNGTSWFPSFAGLLGLQVSHRVLAYTVLAVAGLNAAVQAPPLRGRALLVLGLVLVQVVLGVSNVLLRLPMEITLAHSGTAALVLLSTVWTAHGAWRAPGLASRAQVARPGVDEQVVAVAK